MIGIIGPSNYTETEEKIKIFNKLSKILIANNLGIVFTPTIEGTTEAFAKVYKQNGGKEIIGMEFKDSTYHGYPGLNIDLCSKTIEIPTWENQPKALVQNSEHLIVLGLSTGTIWEMCLSKFFLKNPGKVFVIKELVQEQLPSSLLKELPIEYISLENITSLTFF